jgi:hypothetical protein
LKVFRYRVYGLTIESDTRFPELSKLENPTDRMATEVRVRLRAPRADQPPFSEVLKATTLPDGTPWRISARIEDGYLLRFVGMADFTIDSTGSELTCWRVERGVSADTLRHLVLDQVFPMVLNRRGREALHATAIVTPKGACVFAGPAGSGKSTLAASFFLAGFGALGDDCLPLVEQNGSIRVLPGYPGMRLWRDTITALSAGSGATTPVASYTSKWRALESPSAKNFPREPVPLHRIYQLVRSKAEEPAISRTTIEPIEPREAFVELLSSSFLLDFADPAMLTRHFQLMGKVAATVPVKRLKVPNDLTALGAVREVILADLES